MAAPQRPGGGDTIAPPTLQLPWKLGGFHAPGLRCHVPLPTALAANPEPETPGGQVLTLGPAEGREVSGCCFLFLKWEMGASLE